MFNILKVIQNILSIFSGWRSSGSNQHDHDKHHNPSTGPSQPSNDEYEDMEVHGVHTGGFTEPNQTGTIPKEPKMITMGYLEEVFPRMKNKYMWCDILNEMLSEHEIYTYDRISAFMSQCAHESASFNTLVENLNYSRPALLNVFPKYFTEENVDDYAREPVKIANRVYSNRMGNGDESSGDGWQFRGRGVIQLTGRNNYAAFKEKYDIDVLSDPDLVSTDKRVALLSAIWFWQVNSLNRHADSGDFRTLTRRINGGFNGLEDREKYYMKSIEYFNKIR